MLHRRLFVSNARKNKGRYQLNLTSRRKGEPNMDDFTFYWYYFEDGYRCATKGLSEQELKDEEIKHGKLIQKTEG